MDKYEEALRVIVQELGFRPVGDYYETYNSYRGITFEKGEKRDIRQVELEDYRDDEDVRGWLIWSYWKDEMTDYFGRPADSPCPLTTKETEAFLNFIEAFEKLKLLKKR